MNRNTRRFLQVEGTILGVTFSGIWERRLPRSISEPVAKFMGLLVWENHSEVKEHIPPRPVPPTVWPVLTVRDYTFSIVFVTKYHNSMSRSFLYEAYGFYSGSRNQIAYILACTYTYCIYTIYRQIYITFFKTNDHIQILHIFTFIKNMSTWMNAVHSLLQKFQNMNCAI